MFGLFKRNKNENGKFSKPYYSFRNVKSGRVIDLCQEGEHQGTLIIWDGYGGENQQFTVKQKGPNYLLKCRKTKQFLTVEGPQNGARIFCSPKTGEANQFFRIDENSPGSKEYVIYTYCGKVLDVAEEGKKNGTQVIQWDYHGGKNQLFNFC